MIRLSMRLSQDPSCQSHGFYKSPIFPLEWYLKFRLLYNFPDMCRTNLSLNRVLLQQIFLMGQQKYVKEVNRDFEIV